MHGGLRTRYPELQELFEAQDCWPYIARFSHTNLPSPCLEMGRLVMGDACISSNHAKQISALLAFYVSLRRGACVGSSLC